MKQFQQRATAILAVAFLLASLPCFGASAEQQRPIVRQQTDASCALASLAQVLLWSGRPTTEEQLFKRFLALTEPDEQTKALLNDRGLSVGELIRVIHDQGLSVLDRRRTLPELRAILRREPLIAMIRLSSDPGDRGPGHFTVIETAYPDGSFLIADPILERDVLTERELEDAFARADGRGISLVLRANDGRSLFPAGAVADAASERDPRIPGLQAQLLRIDAAQLQRGRLAVELDIKRVSGPRAQIYDDGEVHISEKQVATVATLGMRYGLSEDWQLAISTPFSSVVSTTRLQAGGEVFEERTHTNSRAESFDLELAYRLGQSDDGALHYTATGGISFSRKGQWLGTSTRLTAAWYPKSSWISVVTGSLGLNHERADAPDSGQRRTSFSTGAAVVWPVSPNASVTLSAQLQGRLDDWNARTRSLQAGFSFSPANGVSVAPYLAFDKVTAQRSRGFGVTITYVPRQGMF